ncbi:oligopeptide transporter, OPT family [bacterium]|nr:oligopeptide transporter, OPT family [bacterium]PIV80950.1 MAG: oligopeptide transporter, OPT family [bacterium CG17_big_fil_post_rev_8_21_14_2_50_64_8]PJA75183.1 MAG: oligopeptide transporter, OPT family [bacterium CG_4_9_14_3_um_filter_65_15]
MEVGHSKTLPENAYRKLEPGETYQPVVPAEKIVPEITAYSVAMGLFFAVVFSAAAAYLGLKIGQVFEAAIPVTILAIGVSAMLGKKDVLQQHVLIQSIGSASGVVVAGAIFTLPGIYILDLADRTNFLQMCAASLLGGFLGILLLIPFRRYFVKDMHGEFPFPEATASTEVLMAGETGGEQASVLVKSGGIAMLFQLLSHQTIGLWRETFSTTAFGFGRSISEKVRLEYHMLTEAAVLGLGYIIGLRYSLIIACGSFLSWWVMIPMIGMLGKGVHVDGVLYQLPALAAMDTGDIFKNFVRPVGIGAIAMSGMIGVWKSRAIIVGAVKLAFNSGAQTGGATEAVERTQHDLPLNMVTLMTFLVLAVVFFFFWALVPGVSLVQAIVGLVIVGGISFLFTTVAARAIAIVGSNPVSGMTLMTLIISSVLLKAVGLSGSDGMVAALLIGGVVCTALSMSGGFVSDLKIGYWLGTTPATQQRWKFLGTVVAAVSVTGVIMLLNATYGFQSEALPAPQANAMAAVIEPLMTGQPAPWLLYMAGVFMALILEWTGLPALAFALGMYLPLSVNTPVLAGGLIAHWVGQGGTEKQQTKRKDKGTLMASGFVAGGAIMGVLAALAKFAGIKATGNQEWSVAGALGLNNWAEHMELSAVVTLIVFCLLGYYLYKSARNAG